MRANLRGGENRVATHTFNGSGGTVLPSRDVSRQVDATSRDRWSKLARSAALRRFKAMKTKINKRRMQRVLK